MNSGVSGLGLLVFPNLDLDFNFGVSRLGFILGLWCFKTRIQTRTLVFLDRVSDADFGGVSRRGRDSLWCISLPPGGNSRETAGPHRPRLVAHKAKIFHSRAHGFDLKDVKLIFCKLLTIVQCIVAILQLLMLFLVVIIALIFFCQIDQFLQCYCCCCC